MPALQVDLVCLRASGSFRSGAVLPTEAFARANNDHDTDTDTDTDTEGNGNISEAAFSNAL